MKMFDLVKVITGAQLTQAERLEAELRHAQAMNAEKAREMARRMGSRYLLSKNYDGHYQPELHARSVR